MLQPIRDIIDGQPTFDKPLPEILAKCKKGGALKILDPIEYITERQRNWYRGIALPELSKWNGDTVDEWDLRLKAECNGIELLKSETIYLGIGMTCTRLTIRGVGKRKMTQYIENILSKSIEKDWPVTPPDPELRSK